MWRRQQLCSYLGRVLGETRHRRRGMEVGDQLIGGEQHHASIADRVDGSPATPGLTCQTALASSRKVSSESELGLRSV